jgi:hypothetical protein
MNNDPALRPILDKHRASINLAKGTGRIIGGILAAVGKRRDIK